MIDLKALRADPDSYRRSQQARGEDPLAVDAVLTADAANRAGLVEFEALRAEQKALGKRIGPLQGAAKRGDEQAQAELSDLMAEAADLAERAKSAEARSREAEAALAAAALVPSNLISPDAPVGGEEDFTVVAEVGTPRDFGADGFEPRDHVELGMLLGAIDVERAAKVSGSRFFYLTGPGALLELALLNLAMAKAVANGFVPVIPPALVQPAAMAGTGFLGQAAENVYRLEADDMYLVGTAEVPLAGDAATSNELPVGFAGLAVVLLFIAAVAVTAAPLARRLHAWRERRSLRRSACAPHPRRPWWLVRRGPRRHRAHTG